jgi:hypothetical protein
MKKSILILTTLILLSHTGYSQPTSNTTKPIGDTTRLNVSNDEINIVNHIIVDLKACNEVADSLKSNIDNYKKLQIKDAQTIKAYQVDSLNLENQLAQERILKESYKKGEKRGRWIKSIAYSLGVVAIVEAGYIYLLSVFK